MKRFYIYAPRNEYRYISCRDIPDILIVNIAHPESKVERISFCNEKLPRKIIEEIRARAFEHSPKGKN